MKTYKLYALFLLLLPYAVFSMGQNSGPGLPELETVNYVEVDSYMGKWYELYRLPNSFEKDCGNVTAEYELLPNGKVSVLNTCVKNTTGKKTSVNGTACVADRQTNSRLVVSFVPLVQRWCWFAGEYNILALGPNYDYALVGGSDRQYLWILSRTKELPEELIEDLKKEGERQLFDTSKLIKVRQEI